MEYNDESFLQISGLQHFSFCRRQWALIHIEQQWAENYRTVDGELMHKNAHDSGFIETRGDCVTMRGVRVHSNILGLSGECDVLEFKKDSGGITLKNKEGLWQPYPIEYKRGKSGEHISSDELQLCAQAMCLEEMLCCDIPRGALYYGETRRRTEIEFTDELREKVKDYAEEMHDYFKRGYTPKVKPSRACNACSLKELCVPKIMRNRSVSEYIRSHLEEIT